MREAEASAVSEANAPRMATADGREPKEGQRRREANAPTGGREPKEGGTERRRQPQTRLRQPQVALVFERDAGEPRGRLRVVPTEFGAAVDTPGVTFDAACASRDGRIFLAGSDGFVHEFDYAARGAGITPSVAWS